MVCISKSLSVNMLSEQSARNGRLLFLISKSLKTY